MSTNEEAPSLSEIEYFLGKLPQEKHALAHQMLVTVKFCVKEPRRKTSTLFVSFHEPGCRTKLISSSIDLKGKKKLLEDLLDMPEVT